MRADGPQRQQLLVVARAYRVRGHPVSVAVGEDISPHLSLLTRLQWSYGAASLTVLGLLVALQRLVVDRSLRPLHEVREDLRRVQAGEVDAIRSEAPAEIAPLVDEVNALLAAMRERLTRSRHALGNLAHALKTQLALLRHELEQPVDVKQRPRLSEPVEVMTRLVERELKRARLAGAGPPGQRADVGETLEALREALQKIYADKDLALELSVPPRLIFEGDAEDLLELAGNLLDNACKWCRRRVRVSAEDGNLLTLIIEDDGPGMGDDALEALPRRGVRADESVPGQGLGVAISAEVAHSYGGSLSFDRSPTLGGLRVRVTLPRHD
jgi:signal transduction histidine kinase